MKEGFEGQNISRSMVPCAENAPADGVVCCMMQPCRWIQYAFALKIITRTVQALLD